MDLKEIQAFFFKAMLEGYASPKRVQKIEIANMPGYKAIPFQDGDFYLVDSYCANPSSRASAGTTTIWFQDTPVWFMSYGGLYWGPEPDIAFLKRALRKAYQDRQFVGGRGPAIHIEHPYLYRNHARRNNFAGFEGREEVTNFQTGVLMGFHDYWGMSLLE